MKKYIFITPSLSKGGAERVISILSNELINKGKNVIIIKHFESEDEYKISPNVKVVNLSKLKENEYRDSINIGYLIKLLIKLRATIRKENPDYIVPFLWTTCFRTGLSLIGTKELKKIILTVRNDPEKYPSRFLLRFLRNEWIKHNLKTIVQNKSQLSYFEKKYNTNIKNRIHILPNPISPEIFLINKVMSRKIRIIGVGRLEEQKNFSLLINAFSNVIKSKDIACKAELKIYGEGSMRYVLEKELKELNLPISILKGRVNDLKQIYSDADIFVLSSNNEGMPNTLLEAMGTGLICISTDCPTGPSDIIEDGKNGLLIPVNDLKTLTKILKKTICSIKEYEYLGMQAKNDIYNYYSSKIITDRFINICEE